MNVCVRERVGVNREGVKIIITESEVLFNKTLVDVELREFHESSQIYIYYILATENKIILKIRPHIGDPNFIQITIISSGRLVLKDLELNSWIFER